MSDVYESIARLRGWLHENNDALRDLQVLVDMTTTTKDDLDALLVAAIDCLTDNVHTGMGTGRKHLALSVDRILGVERACALCSGTGIVILNQVSSGEVLASKPCSCRDGAE